VIGSDPDVIRPGIVLTVRRPAASAPPPGLGRLHPVPPPPAPAGSGHRPLPAGTGAPAASGMPRWLKTTLLAVGLVVGAAFVAGLVLLVLRRRRRGRSAAEEAGIVLADYDRVVVTCSQPADTVYVLRPPGAGPREILRVARLVLPEDLYRELAGQLGMPAGWPIVVADHDRVVVTCSQPADTVYVLRPPGADPREILRVARLVVPEVPYGELADQLGVPASWPMEKEVPAEAGRGQPPWPASWLAWSILLIMAAAAGMTGPVRPAQAGTSTARSAEVTLTSTPGAAAAPGPAARPAVRYVVQPGDTLAGIAAALAVRGGWPALYAANRPRVGPDPDVIRPGTVLMLPGRRAPAPAGPSPAGRPVPPSAPAGIGHRPLPAGTGAPAAAGMPQWLKTVLLAAGLVTGAACLGGLVLLARRRQQAAARIARSGNVGVGRSRSVAGAVRPVTAAARVHPAGVAVPGAVLAAGIVLFTFVESATLRAVPPPGGSGPGPVPAARPGTGQPDHRL